MKQLLLLVLPCIVAIVLVNAQTGSVGGVGGVGGTSGGGIGGFGGYPRNAVYYPYPVQSRTRPSIIGPLLQEIQAENNRAMIANLCKSLLFIFIQVMLIL